LVERLPVASAPSLAFQGRLTTMLDEATPAYEAIAPAAIPDRLAAEFAPIALTASGPTWRDRVLGELRFKDRGVAANRRAAQQRLGLLPTA
jgi:hypothetical protein